MDLDKDLQTHDDLTKQEDLWNIRTEDGADTAFIWKYRNTVFLAFSVKTFRCYQQSILIIPCTKYKYEDIQNGWTDFDEFCAGR